MYDMMDNNFEYLPLRDVVFNTLRQEILTGKLKPGERLREIQLADKMGVSRTPIREAIRMLELEGLVKMLPRKGAEVAQITEKDLNDVIEVRTALEQLAIELACKKITSEEIFKLKANVIEFKNAVESTDVSTLAKIDVGFHDIIFNATDNKRLIQLLNNLREQMYRYRLEYLKDSAVHSMLIEEHKEIIKNLEEGDVVSAKNNIAEHIIKQASTVSKRIEE